MRTGRESNAVKKELNLLRRISVIGESLLKSLIRIYDQHGIKDAGERCARGGLRS